RVGIAFQALGERLHSEVVEERQPVVVAYVEEEVDEVRVLVWTPPGRADGVHDREAENVAVERDGPGRVECRVRDVVDTADTVVEFGHEVTSDDGRIGRV